MTEKRIIQITDIHITKESEFFRSADDDKIDSRANFLRVLDECNLQKDDLLVISGDIAAYSADPEIYEWVKIQLEQLTNSQLVMPGNHDNSRMMQDFFSWDHHTDSEEIFGVIPWSHWNLYFLDTSTDTLSTHQMKWMIDHSRSHRKKSVVFMHHPPVTCGNKWMDTRQPLNNRDEIWPMFKEVSGLQGIFCGHYHDDCNKVVDDIPVFVTPSTVYQIQDDESRSFKRKDISSIGYRVLRIENNSIRTQTYYLEA